MQFRYEGHALTYPGMNGYAGIVDEPVVTGTFNDFYASNLNVTTGVIGSWYPTQLTFLPKIPKTCVNGEKVYFYMLTGDRYPAGVQHTYGLYKGNKNGWTAEAQANADGAWGNNPGTDWPAGNLAAKRSFSAIPNTTLSASLFRTCLVWDDSYDGIWIDWLHDPGEAWDFSMASYSTAADSAFAVTDPVIIKNMFSQQSATGNSGTYGNVSGQYFFWGTKSFLE